MMTMLKVGDMKFPLDRYYHKTHTWLKVESLTAKVGMDSFQAENAGYLRYLTIGASEAKQGEPIGSYESSKFVSKIYSPISGRIRSVNENVLRNPRRINEDPYNSWIVEIQPDDLENDLNSRDILKKEEDIREWIEKEVERMEDEREP